MTAKFTDAHDDDIIQRYLSGETPSKIAERYGISKDVIARILKENATQMRPSAWSPKVFLPGLAVAEMYVTGKSVNAISKHYGCTRSTVVRVLKEAGIRLRGRSEAETVKWAQMKSASRRRQTEAAQEAVRGRKRSFETLCKTAKTRETRQTHKSVTEDILASMLQRMGFAPVIQKAIGPYNCDLAVHPVAMEIFGGGWHWHGLHLRRSEKRFRYILDRGWNILAVVISPPRWPLNSEVADYIGAYLEALSSHPPEICEYRMIRGAGELLASGRADDDHIAIIPALRSTRDPVSGRYKSVPR